MTGFRSKILARFLALILSFISFLPATAMANSVNERPTAAAMGLDLVIARPLLGLATVMGVGGFILSLPFAAIGKNIEEVADNMVVAPFNATVMRCLGCTRRHVGGSARDAGY